MRGRGGGKKRGSFPLSRGGGKKRESYPLRRGGLGLPGRGGLRVVPGDSQSKLTPLFGSGALSEKRGGGRGRGGPVSHKNLYTVEKNLVGVGRSSQNEPHDDNDDDDVVLVDEEGNDQAQQQNDDLRSVLNERR